MLLRPEVMTIYTVVVVVVIIILSMSRADTISLFRFDPAAALDSWANRERIFLLNELARLIRTK